jgi:hypothetical protein
MNLPGIGRGEIGIEPREWCTLLPTPGTGRAPGSARGLVVLFGPMARGSMQQPLGDERGFADLSLTNWRQFGQVDIAFHPRMTILTGANGAGKTTLLNLLNRHFGWFLQFIEVPGLSSTIRSDSVDRELFDVGDIASDTEAAHLLSKLESRMKEASVQGQLPAGWSQRPIGSLRYPSGADAILALAEPPPGSAGQVSNVVLVGQRNVEGLNIPAHRTVGGYQAVTNIPTAFNATRQLLDAFINEVRNRYMNLSPSQQNRTPLYWMKEALIAAAIYGEGNSSVEPNPEASLVFIEFQEILSRLLPPSMGFQRLYIKSPEVVVVTNTGAFPIDAISGGVSTIMELAWQIFLRARLVNAFVVCIDEPENHLHPALQRVLLPRLLEAFPNVQFVISTHSPSIVSSVADSTVYVLRFDERGRVRSLALDLQNRAGTANEILRDVLGVTTSMPEWAEDRLRGIVSRYADADLTAESLQAMRDELSSLGLDEVTPAAVVELFRRSKQTE